jgi:O-antigen/teichoic acid export membrane protein
MGLKFDRGMFRELRRFGTPYQVSWVERSFLTFGDRFFLQAARGTSAVGLYSFGLPASCWSAGSTPFLSAWNPHGTSWRSSRKVKGAAGQAVQNANLMLGIEETTGLLGLAGSAP